MESSEAFRVHMAVQQQTGQLHLIRGEPSQDVVFTQRCGNHYFCGLADGQSGCRYGAAGGQASLQAAARYLEKECQKGLLDHPHQEEIRFGLSWSIRDCLRQLAQRYRTGEDEFSSTLLLLRLCLEDGRYLLVHLGDGCAVGIRTEGTAHILSPPENGVTSQYTWQTTAENLAAHLRIYSGKLSLYRRLALMSDGAKCLCRGKNISSTGRHLLTEGSAEEIGDCLRENRSEEDSSCILINVKRINISHLQLFLEGV